MVTSLIYHERITTTTAKAKELRKVADLVIGYAKRGQEHNRQHHIVFLLFFFTFEILFLHIIFA